MLEYITVLKEIKVCSGSVCDSVTTQYTGPDIIDAIAEQIKDLQTDNNNSTSLFEDVDTETITADIISKTYKRMYIYVNNLEPLK